MDKKEPEFPNLQAVNAYDRQQHIERAMEAGLTREQAERHADEHLRRSEGERPYVRDTLS